MDSATKFFESSSPLVSFKKISNLGIYLQLKVHHRCHSHQQHWWQIFWWKGQWPLNTLQLHVSLLWLTSFLYSVSRCCRRFCCCQGFSWCGILLLLTSFFFMVFLHCLHLLCVASLFKKSCCYWQFWCRWSPALVNMLLLPVLPLIFVSLLMFASLQWLVFLPSLAFMPLCDILRLICVLRLLSLKTVENFLPALTTMVDIENP